MLLQQTIPDAMTEIGLKEFTTADGVGIEIRPEIQISIPKASESKALAWMRKNKLADLIKTQLAFAFGRGDDKAMEQMMAAARKEFKEIPMSAKSGVHAQTLKAWAKERRKDGKDIPTDLFSLYEYQQAKITIKE